MLLVPWEGAAAALWAVVDREIESDMVDSNDFLMDTKKYLCVVSNGWRKN